jgi:hypothetical protein
MFYRQSGPSGVASESGSCAGPGVPLKDDWDGPFSKLWAYRVVLENVAIQLWRVVSSA